MPRIWKLLSVLAAIIGLSAEVWAAPPGGGAPFRIVYEPVDDGWPGYDEPTYTYH